MIYILKILFFYINFTIFTFAQTRLIFQNVNNNLIYQDKYAKYCYYINEDFINNKIEYYRKCYEYINNVPADVKFKDYDKENAKNHLIIGFCEIVMQKWLLNQKNFVTLHPLCVSTRISRDYSHLLFINY